MRLPQFLLAATSAASLLACDRASDVPSAPNASGPTALVSGFITSQPAQATGLAGAVVTPIITVGDPIPGATAPDPQYNVWAPVPDGLGAYKKGNSLVVYANHELPAAGIGGEFTYSRVSRLTLDLPSLGVTSGDYPLTATSLLERLCSATFAGAKEGLQPGFFLTGEESTTGTKNGTTVAIDENGNITELPWLGHYQHENQVIVPRFPGKIVAIGLDDTRGASELYLYVASNRPELMSGGGELHVFTAQTSGEAHAGDLTVGQTITGEFKKIQNPTATSAALQTAVTGLGAFPFVRLEDGTYRKQKINGFDNPTIYFVDTGSDAVTVCGPAQNAVCDLAGSVYGMELDAADPTKNAKLTLLARSAGAPSGWASPDNIDASANTLMVQEDPAYPGFKRAPKIWAFPLTASGVGAPTAVVEVNDPLCDEPTGNCWESSGIIDASEWLGAGSWLFDVQAHSLPFSYEANGQTVNVSRDGGQLLYLNVPGS